MPATLVALALVATVGAWTRPPVVEAATSPFTDIAGTTFAADIEWLWAEGVTVGCSPTAYCPDAPVIRGQMASFLVRMFDLSEGAAVDAFTDDDGTTHEADINRLAHAGITKGCTPTTFCPADPVRRDAMASFLVRAIGLTEGDGRNYFRDDDGTTHEADIDRLAAGGIASGCGTWRYCPAGAVSRGQMAGFLHRVEVPLTAELPYPAPDAETILHVATDGSDAANLCRLEASPCRTIRHALALAIDGNTIDLAGGTFDEENLTVAADVTITGESGGTIIDASGGTGWPGRIFLVPAGRTVALEHLILTGGEADACRPVYCDTPDGGAILNRGTLTVTRSIIIGGWAFETAAGIWSDGTLTVIDSTISANAAGGSGMYAASIENWGTMVVSGSTVSGNDTGQGTGGILNGGAATVVNSTIAKNHADYGCGGIYNIGGGTLAIKNSTVADNGSDESNCNTGNEGTLRLTNSIVTKVSGPITSQLASIVGVPAGLTLADILDPDGLADNGGPTETIALTDSAKNPAIDKGDAATCAAAPVSGVDQRGEPRTPPCDIGAYELQP